ncbi:hypothetical protein HPB47_026309, partial [Ixodes persulcatus]
MQHRAAQNYVTPDDSAQDAEAKEVATTSSKPHLEQENSTEEELVAEPVQQRWKADSTKPGRLRSLKSRTPSDNRGGRYLAAWQVSTVEASPRAPVLRFYEIEDVIDFFQIRFPWDYLMQRAQGSFKMAEGEAAGGNDFGEIDLTWTDKLRKMVSSDAEWEAIILKKMEEKRNK